MPDPYFRISVAAMAKQDYATALSAYQKGMELSQAWPASPFSLDYMYREDKARKAADLGKLEQAVQAAPQQANMQLLAGITFYTDGQTEKATAYLQNAQKTDANLKNIVEPLLKNIEESAKMDASGEAE